MAPLQRTLASNGMHNVTVLQGLQSWLSQNDVTKSLPLLLQFIIITSLKRTYFRLIYLIHQRFLVYSKLVYTKAHCSPEHHRKMRPFGREIGLVYAMPYFTLYLV